MSYSSGPNDLRASLRVDMICPAQITIGSQLTLNGQVKDLSQKSAFIQIKSSAYVQLNDEIGFILQPSAHKPEELITGQGRISRLVPGEGIAIYFVTMDVESAKRLKELVVHRLQ